MVPNVTTWGGGAIFDGQKHHLFVSRMTNDCSLDHWRSNSRIDHAVSTTGAQGPYEFVDVAINTWAHNAAPITLPDGSYAIVHIGTGEGGPDGGANCTPSAARDSRRRVSQESFARQKLHDRLEADAKIAAQPNGGSTIHVSKSLYGPWIPLQNTLGSCNNPAPWVHPNGTIYVG